MEPHHPIMSMIRSHGDRNVGNHTKLTDKQVGTETKKRTFTDIIKKGKLPRDLLIKGLVEQLK